jgi:MFS family permease
MRHMPERLFQPTLRLVRRPFLLQTQTSLPSVAATLRFDAEAQAAWVTSSVLVGALFGALGGGSFADALGPARAIIFNCLPLALGSLLSAIATSEAWLVCGRVLCGIGTGAASLFVPRYLTEIGPTPIRGLLSTLHQICINVGIIVAFALGWPYEKDVGFAVRLFGRVVPWWRCMFISGIVLGVLQAIVMYFCPESPVWLGWKGRNSEAGDALRRLHGNVLENITEESAASEQGRRPLLEQAHHVEEQDEEGDARAVQGAGIREASHGDESASSAGFSALLQPRYRRVVLLAFALPFLQQLSGINTVILYGSEVFRKAGVKSAVSANLLMGCTNLVATFGAAMLMDRAGRKVLLTWSFVGMSGCLGCMAAFLMLPSKSSMYHKVFVMFRGCSLKKHRHKKIFMCNIQLYTSPKPKHIIDDALFPTLIAAPAYLAGPVSIAAILSYTVAFALGCGPVPWVYLPEILPPIIKGPAQAAATALNWGGNMLVGFSFPPSLRVLGLGGSYAVYAVACAGAALFCERRMVETKRRSLPAVHAELMAD